MLQDSPESGYDWGWEGVEPDQGGRREGEEGKRDLRVGRLPQKLLPGREVLVHG